MNAVGDLFNLIKEINLGTIKDNAEKPFRFLIVGDRSLGTEFAELLSEEPGKQGIHPWIVISEGGARTDEWGVPVITAFFVTPHVEPAAVEVEMLHELNMAGIPIMTVVVHAGAGQLVGATITRRAEQKRVVVTALDTVSMVSTIAPAIAEVVPTDWKVAAARQFPPLRNAIAQGLVEETSRANAVYATTTAVGEIIPGLNIALTAADMIVLTKNQLIMAYKIALAAGKQGSPMDVMGEVISVIGGGFLLRQLARELVGLIPVVGAIPKVAVAYAGTWIMGRTVTLWAMEGHRLNPSEARRFYDEAVTRGRQLAETLVEKVRRDPKALPAPVNANGTEVAVTQAKSGWLDRLKARFRRSDSIEVIELNADGTPKRWWHRLPFLGRK